MPSNFFYLDTVVNFIEDHIDEKITLDILSESMNLSKYHLHRITTAVLGRPLMEYVRARKLSKSLDRLIYSDLRILDIAKEFGFNYEQTYIKAFKNEFGVTPSAYRRGHVHIVATEKFDMSQITEVDNCMITKPQFIIRGPICLVGIKHYFTTEANKTSFKATEVGNDFFYNERHKISRPVKDTAYIGYSRLRENDPSPNLYMTALEVDQVQNLPENMDSLTLPRHQYAVFKYIGDRHSKYMSYKNVEGVLNYMFMWLETSSFIQADAFVFEEIDASVATETYCEIDIHIPVKSIK